MPSDQLTELATLASGYASRGPAPVHRWDPPFCGDLDIVIKRDGNWFHEGRPIKRKELVKLFSSILKKEDDRYYLVTPAEKVGITVERCPFMIIGMDVRQQNGVQFIRFHTSSDEQIIADSEHHLALEKCGVADFPHPVIHVRDGLTGLLSRAVFYRLAEIAVEHTVKQAPRLGVFSSGIFFPLD